MFKVSIMVVLVATYGKSKECVSQLKTFKFIAVKN